MGYRRKDARPRLALWMLVALGDAVLLLVSGGLSILFALVAVVAFTVAGVAVWRWTRRGAPVRQERMSTVAVPAVTRRRA